MKSFVQKIFSQRRGELHQLKETKASRLGIWSTFFIVFWVFVACYFSILEYREEILQIAKNPEEHLFLLVIGGGLGIIKIFSLLKSFFAYLLAWKHRWWNKKITQDISENFIVIHPLKGQLQKKYFKNSLEKQNSWKNYDWAKY